MPCLNSSARPNRKITTTAACHYIKAVSYDEASRTYCGELELGDIEFGD